MEPLNGVLLVLGCRNFCNRIFRVANIPSTVKKKSTQFSSLSQHPTLETQHSTAQHSKSQSNKAKKMKNSIIVSLFVSLTIFSVASSFHIEPDQLAIKSLSKGLATPQFPTLPSQLSSGTVVYMRFGNQTIVTSGFLYLDFVNFHERFDGASEGVAFSTVINYNGLGSVPGNQYITNVAEGQVSCINKPYFIPLPDISTMAKYTTFLGLVEVPAYGLTYAWSIEFPFLNFQETVLTIAEGPRQGQLAMVFTKRITVYYFDFKATTFPSDFFAVPQTCSSRQPVSEKRSAEEVLDFSGSIDDLMRTLNFF